MRIAKSTTTVVRMKSIGLIAGVGAVVALAGAPAALNGQERETKTGWQPYLGCWQPQLAASGDWMLSGNEVDEGMLCFVPSGADVEMLTIVEGSISYRETFRTDGLPREIAQEGCSGRESASFSDDQRRIYTISELSCDGEAPRRSTGIISMPSPGEWLDVRAIEMNGVSTAWSQWYQRTDGSVLRELGFADLNMPSPFSVRGAVAYANTVISIDDVIDASANVAPEAVEGWIAAVRQEFINLDADDLLRLEEAGVSTRVIDVVVAVSFPARFAFGQQGAAPEEGEYEGTRAARRIYADPYFNPFYSRYGYGYGSYGYGYGYGGYGYGYGGYGGWRGGYVPVVVNVNRTRPSTVGGRVVAGRGYRGPRSISGGSSGGRSWVGSSGGSRGSASSGGSSGGTRKAKPRGGSSSMSSGGSSPIRSIPSTSSRSSGSRSSGSSTGRTAKRRGGR